MEFVLYDYAGHRIASPAPPKAEDSAAAAGVPSHAAGQSPRAKRVEDRKHRFLVAFRNLGNVLKACRIVGVGRTCHYDWLREDAEYRAAFDEAQIEAARILEDEAHRRATEGFDEPVFYKGKVVGYKRIYSDLLMAKLLAGRNPAVFSQRTNLRLAGPDGEKLEGMQPFDAVIAQARVELAQAERRLENDEPTDD